MLSRKLVLIKEIGNTLISLFIIIMPSYKILLVLSLLISPLLSNRVFNLIYDLGKSL